MLSRTATHCVVCGLDQGSPPWGEDGTTPSFDICECCGVEFGYEDYTIESARDYRRQWLAGGAKWWRPRGMPPDWDLAAQLKNVPEIFR